MSEKGLRYDKGKPRTDLLCPTALMALSEVMARGAEKYGEGNWQLGMPWRKVIGPLLRHTFKFMRGEDTDEESGLPHVDLMLANCMILSNYYREHKAYDNRIKKKEDKNGI
jgi:hypothetical protein